MDKESYDKIFTAIEDAGYEPREYSGRGMYGRQCLGVTCERPAGFMVALFATMCENADDVDEIREVAEALQDPSEDAMGRDAIIYWPSIRWQGEAGAPVDDHGVEVSTEDYEDAHDKKPRGDGRWVFFTGPEGEDKYYSFDGEYRECLAKACEKAANDGFDFLAVGS